MFCKNARTKLAMASDLPTPNAMNVEQPESSQSHTASTPSPPPQQPTQGLPADVPLALLQAILAKEMPPSGASYAPPVPVQQEGPVPSRLLQQAQYANLLMERQIQMLQQEQAKHQAFMALHAQKPQQEGNLMRMQQLVQMQQQRKKVPTNHRASAA
jgi:hypothetical protein